MNSVVPGDSSHCYEQVNMVTTKAPRVLFLTPILQLHTTMSRRLLSVNLAATPPLPSRDLLAKGKSRNFRQVNRDISRKELETKTRDEMR